MRYVTAGYSTPNLESVGYSRTFSCGTPSTCRSVSLQRDGFMSQLCHRLEAHPTVVSKRWILKPHRHRLGNWRRLVRKLYPRAQVSTTSPASLPANLATLASAEWGDPCSGGELGACGGSRERRLRIAPSSTDGGLLFAQSWAVVVDDASSGQGLGSASVRSFYFQPKLRRLGAARFNSLRSECIYHVQCSAVQCSAVTAGGPNSQQLPTF